MDRLEGPGLDQNIALISSRSNQVTFLLPSGILRHKPQSLPAGTGWVDSITTIRMAGWQCMEDGKGTIWFRDLAKHVYHLAGTNLEVMPSGAETGLGLANWMVTDPRGQLWAGTDSGIAVWNGTRFLDATPTNSESPVKVEFLSVGEDGGLWAVANGDVRKAIGRRWVWKPSP